MNGRNDIPLIGLYLRDEMAALGHGKIEVSYG